MIGYKVMAYDAGRQEAVSGANSRLRVPLRVSETHRMPAPGIWLSLDRDYVVDYYAVHEANVLLTYEFDPKQVLAGNLTDRETEFAVPSAKLMSVEVLRTAEQNTGVPYVVKKKNGEIIDSVAKKFGKRRAIITFHTAPWDADDVWSVALVIGATRKDKKAMREQGSLNAKHRTKAGLISALRWAAQQLDKFQEERPEATLVVNPSDDARRRAYAWLLRKGFQSGEYGGEKVYVRFPR